MSWQVVPIERRHIAGFREVLDGVARERRYLAFLEAPPMARVRRFVLDGLRAGIAQYVAVDGERVVGWCDVTPRSHETLRHSGALGMGVAASHRGIGVGAALLGVTLEGALALVASEVAVRSPVAGSVRSIRSRSSGPTHSISCRRTSGHRRRSRSPRKVSPW